MQWRGSPTSVAGLTGRQFPTPAPIQTSSRHDSAPPRSWPRSPTGAAPGKDRPSMSLRPRAAAICWRPRSWTTSRNGRVLERQGNAVPDAAPHAIFPCLGDESWCAIAIFTDAQWEALCRVSGNPGWSTNESYATHAGRKQCEAEIYELVSQWTRTRAPEEVESLLTSHDIPASSVARTSDLVERDEHLKSRGFFRSLEHAVIGPHINRGPAFKLSRSEDCSICGSRPRSTQRLRVQGAAWHDGGRSG